MLLLGRPRIPQIGDLLVDQNHTLARGLHDCVVFNVGGRHGLVNLAGQRLGVALSQLVSGALPNWQATIDGVSLTTVGNGATGAGGVINITNQGDITVGGQDCAFRVRFIVTSLQTGGFAAIIGKFGSPREIGLFLSATGTISQINLGASTVSNPAGNTVAVNVVQDILVTRIGGVGTLYQNGVATVTGMTLTGAGGAAATQPLQLGNDGHGGGPESASFLAVQTWTRNITAAEALELYLDPFCFLISPQMVVPQMFTAPPPLPMMGQIWI